MKRLKNLLKSKWFLLFLFFLFCMRFCSVVLSSPHSSYDLEDTSFSGRVEEVVLEEDTLHVTIRTSKERMRGTLHFQKKEEVPVLEWNDFVLIRGTLKEFSRNTVPYLFNYREYAKRHRQFYSIDIQSIHLLEKNHNPFYAFKTAFKNKMDKMKSASYLYAFLFGDTSFISDEVMESYRDNGVSHLLAISGMHVSFLIGIISFILEKAHVSEKLQWIIYFSFLGFYIWLVGFSPSVVRASLFFLLLRLSKVLSLDIRPIFLLLFLFFFLLFINPFYLWEVGFQYSFAISFVLVLSNSLLAEGSYFRKLLVTSYLSFLSSIVIGVFHFHQIQLLSVFYNLFFVPIVSFIVFPLSFITFFIPILEPVYLFFIRIMETVSLFFARFRSSIWVMRHPSILGILYLTFTVLFVYGLLHKKRRYHVFLLLLLLFLYHNASSFIPDDYMISLDVGQGDATFLSSSGETMLIDTGGSIYKDYAKLVLLPYLKAKGVFKIDTLVLTHGDYDHLGAALSLLHDIPVQKVIFNANNFNNQEQKIIKYLEKKQIAYEQNRGQMTYQVGSFEIVGNSLDVSDENDASIVLLGKGLGFSFLLMGDASLSTEQTLMNTYFTSNVDILKVGHHGSKTSTGETFLQMVDPKIALISSGKNNRFSHPHQEVVEKLLKHAVSIYSTQDVGSITIDFRKHGNISVMRP